MKLVKPQHLTFDARRSVADYFSLKYWRQKQAMAAPKTQADINEVGQGDRQRETNERMRKIVEAK